MILYTKMCLDKNKVLTISEEINHIAWPTTQTCEEGGGEGRGGECLLSYPFHTRRDRRFDIHSIDE